MLQSFVMMVLLLVLLMITLLLEQRLLFRKEIKELLVRFGQEDQQIEMATIF